MVSGKYMVSVISAGVVFDEYRHAAVQCRIMSGHYVTDLVSRVAQLLSRSNQNFAFQNMLDDRISTNEVTLRPNTPYQTS